MIKMYRKYRLLIHTAITILIMTFIFYQSSLPAILSSEMSGHLERIVAWILGKPSESVTFAVRKAAHVTEFTALGISLYYTVRDFLEWKYGKLNPSAPKNYRTSQSVISESEQVSEPQIPAELSLYSSRIMQNPDICYKHACSVRIL